MEKQDKTELAKELNEELSKLAESYILEPDKFIEMLKFQSKFTNYSSRNTSLIKLQNPHASFVASFKKLKDLGYNVNKGEKALYVFAPIKNAAIEINGEIKSLKELNEEEKEPQSIEISKLSNSKAIKEIQADVMDVILSAYFDVPITEKRIAHIHGYLKEISEKELEEYIYPVIDKSTKELSSIKEIRQELEQEQQIKLEDKSYELDL